ncbi:MAG: hypothetical protein ACOCXR_01630 [Phototrophicaceae bacterium]
MVSHHISRSQGNTPDQGRASRVETFDYGISRYWIADGRIAVIATEGNMRREAIDSWAEATLGLMDIWPEGQPYAHIQKLDAPGQGFTQYSRQRTQELIARLPSDRPCYTAVVLADAFINRVFGFFLRTVRHNGKQQQERVFFTLDEAQAWLLEKLDALEDEQASQHEARC